jgi:hypothetical protein
MTLRCRSSASRVADTVGDGELPLGRGSADETHLGIVTRDTDSSPAKRNDRWRHKPARILAESF